MTMMTFKRKQFYLMLYLPFSNDFTSSFQIPSLPEKNHFRLNSLTGEEQNTATSHIESVSNPKELGPSPAASFGTPISEFEETVGRAGINFVKNTVFDSFFHGKERSYARFYALETIARVPYFSYLSVLHFYETIGWWRRASYLKIHFAESWNEMHHLLIMEELGGSHKFADRFLAQHTAFFYFWFVVTAYLINPILAYNLNESVEKHAFETYDEFIKENRDRLQDLPAPQAAKDYYLGEDLYMLNTMQTCDDSPRKIKCETLLDTFIAIREDEWEHVKTMKYLQNVNADVDTKEECELMDIDEGYISSPS